jgi:hypothetical protein
MDKKKPRQAISISWDIFSQLMILRGKLATPENKIKVKDLVEDALTIYIESKTK